MIRFTDKKMYLKGTSIATLIDKATGNIMYWSDKFQTANYQTSVTMGEIRAGLGNGIAAMLPTDAGVTVNFTAADFSFTAKAAQLGAARSFGAPVMTCQEVVANSATLTIDVSGGVPVAALGMTSAVCWVQEVGAAATLADTGIAYPISAGGVVSGFAATVTKTYKVTYFATRANAEVATITTAIDPTVGYFMSAMAVYYGNGGAASNDGTRCGTLWAIVPSLKLNAEGGIVGDQTTNDTTSMSGQAIASDDEVISSGCADCQNSGAVLAYYIYVPCDTNSGIDGIIGQLGGAVIMGVGDTYQLTPSTVIGNRLNRAVPPADYSYTSADTTIATVTSGGVVTGASVGDTEITVTYTVGSTPYTDDVNVSITA